MNYFRFSAKTLALIAITIGLLLVSRMVGYAQSENQIYLPLIPKSDHPLANSGIYTDPTYGYSVEVPTGWDVSPASSIGIGGVTILSEPAGKANIEIGVEIYARPSDVPLSEWVAPSDELRQSLLSQELMSITRGEVVVQTYERGDWSGKIVYIPFGSKVIFVELIPAVEEYNDLLFRVADTLAYAEVTASSEYQWPELERLYPESEQNVIAQDENASGSFILPFSGKAQITQTGDDGQSHNCSGAYTGDCEALDFVLPSGDGKRVYSADAGDVIFRGLSPEGYGNLVKIRHANGLVSWYAHLSSFQPPASFSTVSRGQLLGIEGRTGCDETYNCSSHLHFMIKIGDGEAAEVTPVDISNGLLPGLEFESCTTDTSCGWAYGGPALFRPGSSGLPASEAWSQVFGISDPWLGDDFIGNDQATYIVVPERWDVRLYPERDYGGASVRHAGPTSAYISMGVSSLQVNYPVNSCPAGSVMVAQSCTTPSPTSSPTAQPTATGTPTPSGGNVEIVSINSPSNVSPGQRFLPSITVKLNNGQQLLESRGDMIRPSGGTNYTDFPHVGVRGAVNSGQTYTFQFYNQHPFVAPNDAGTYESKWRVWASGNWVGPEIVIRFTVGSGSNNHSPGTPSLRGPRDWSEIRSEQAPELCWNGVGDPDGDAVEYYAEIYESASGADSGWISGTCWRPNRIDAHYAGYKWHVKARDTRGGESGWSEAWHFTLSPPPYDPVRPTSVPQPTPALPTVEGSWWDGNYAYRRVLPIVANETLPAGLVIKLDLFDLNALVAEDKVRADYADVRVVRRLSDSSWREVARQVYANWDVEFQLLDAIAPGTDSSYYVYYGNPDAGSAPTFDLPPNGWWVDLYKDKWWSSWAATAELNQAIDFDDICGPPVNHRDRVGTTFDDSDKYRGRLFIPTTGRWTFYIYSNDGYSLYIDGAEVGRFDGYEGNRWVTVGSIDLKSGWHTFEAPDMWVNCGAFKLQMEGPDFGRQTIPQAYYQKQWGNIRGGVVAGNEEPFSLPNVPVTPMPHLVGDVAFDGLSIIAGKWTTATYTVSNVGEEPLVLKQLVLAVRGPDCIHWCDERNADWPVVTDITIPPGGTYTVQNQDYLDQPGDYLAKVVFQDIEGQWREVVDSPQFTISVAPGIMLQESLTISPTEPLAGEMVTFRFKVKNISAESFLLEKILAAGRGPDCGDEGHCDKWMDAPLESTIELAPGQEHIYVERRLVMQPGDYFYQSAYQLSPPHWIQLGAPLNFHVGPGIRVVGPMQLVPSQPVAGEVVSATYTIRNDGPRAIVLPYLGAVARGPNCAGSSWECEAYADWPRHEEVRVEPHQQYTFQSARSLDVAGDGYWVEPQFADTNPWWLLIDGGGRTDFAVQPGIELVTPLQLIPSDPVVGEMITASAVIRNLADRPVTLYTLFVGVQGPGCSDFNCAQNNPSKWNDFPAMRGVTIQPGAQYQYESSRMWLNEGPEYIAQLMYQFEENRWHHLGDLAHFTVGKGLHLMEDLVLSPSSPQPGEVYTATFAVGNDGPRAITIPALGIGGRDAHCSDEDCYNNAGMVAYFDVVIPAGGTYEYVARRTIDKPGEYFIEPFVYAAHPNWWMPFIALPNSHRVTFTVGSGYQPPTTLPSCSMTIENGAIFTNRLAVELTVNAPDATTLLVSNDGGFIGSVSMPYRTEFSWTFPDDIGNRVMPLTVRIRARNGEQQVCASDFSDDIVFDPVPPAISARWQPPTLLSADVEQVQGGTVQIVARDQVDGSGIGEMQISATPEFPDPAWIPFADSLEVPDTDSALIYLRVRDKAGNVSNTIAVVVGKSGSFYLPSITK